VSRIQEYDLEIRPTKLVKGQGLVKLLAKGNERALDINVVLDDLENNEWSGDIIYYLKNVTCPNPLAITREEP